MPKNFEWETYATQLPSIKTYIGKLYLTSILLDEIQIAGLKNVPARSLVCERVGPINDIWRYNQYFYKPQPTLLSI